MLGYATLASAASTGSIWGYVKDADSGEPLPGANVFLEGTSIGAATNAEGKYEISQVPPGTYTLVIRYIGYKEKKIPVTVVANEALRQDVALPFVTIEGETVVVTVQAEGQMEAINQQISSNTIKNVVSSARIQELPDNNAAESVGRLPGVSIKRSGGEGNKVVIRGLSPKYNNITLNGVRMASTGSGDRSTDISMISPMSNSLAAPAIAFSTTSWGCSCRRMLNGGTEAPTSSTSITTLSTPPWKCGTRSMPKAWIFRK